MKARVSKPALKLMRGKVDRMHCLGEINKYWRLESACSVMEGVQQRTQTVLESWVLVSVRDTFCAQNA